MKKKPLLAILLLVTALCVTVPIAFADGEYTYTVTSNNTCTITGYTGSDTVLNIPSTINGYAVTKIGHGAFNDCGSIVSVSIPNGVTSIEDWAFDDCTSMVSVSIPDGVISIGRSAFDYCTSLTSIVIPDSVTHIGYRAFYNCNSAKNITLSNNLTVIEDNAFAFCKSLTNITIPEGVTSIEQFAFDACSNLENIDLPTSLSGIGKNSFARCYNLKSIDLPVGVTSIGDNAFAECRRLATVTIPDGVAHIGASAFAGCGLTSLTLPDSIVSIGANAIASSVVVKLGTNSVIEAYCKENNIQYICDSGTTVEQFTSVEEKIEWVIKNHITSGMSEYRKALILYEWLCEHVVYDYSYLDTDIPTSELGVGGEAAILDGTAVCQGYAEGYQWLLEAVGIDAVLVDGDNHAWNMAQIDGKWYQFDPTWDDTGGGTTHDYFGLSTDAMSHGHPTQYSHLHIVCDSYAANYYYRQGAYDKTVTTLQNAILTNISEGIYSGSVDGDHYNNRGSNYTIALIVEGETEWPMNGYAEITPSDGTMFNFVFYPNDTPVSSIDIVGLELSADMDSYDMYVGYTAQMEVITEPAGVPVTFASSNESVLTVSSTGVVTAMNEGKATITVNAGSYNISFTIYVSWWAFNEENMYLAPSASGQIYLWKYKNWFLTDTACTWNSSDSNVATVNNQGLVTAITEGTATITLTTAAGESKSITVYVREPAASLIFTQEVYKVYVGEKLYLASLYFEGGSPEFYKECWLDYSSSDKSIAYQNGRYNPTWNEKGGYWEHHPSIVGVAPGEVTLTATAGDGSNLRCTCIIRVVQPPMISEIVLLDAQPFGMCIGKQAIIKLQVVADDPDFYDERYGDFACKITNEAVVAHIGTRRSETNEVGWVYYLYFDGLTVGETKVTFLAQDGSNISAEGTIVVAEHEEMIIPAVPPTCNDPGLTEGKYCSVCNEELVTQNPIPALGHIVGKPVVIIKPTKTEDGLRGIQCSICKEILRSESIPAGSMRFPGDTNEDGMVDIFDALLLMQHEAGWDVSLNTDNADMYEDGLVNMTDLELLLQ